MSPRSAPPDTLTGRHFDHRAQLKPSVRAPKGHLEIRGATQHNLKNVDVDVPLGILTVVTGVAGSGKSSLIHGNVPAFDDVVVVDQSAIKGSRRSSPATYTGPARRHPRRVREGERREARLLQRQLRGRVPRLQGPRA